MPLLPVPSQTDITIQNQATGQVDYLKYQGNNLVASSVFDYGLNPDFKIVAAQPIGGGLGLVAQSASTGFVDFLALDANGNLVGSAMSSVPVPHIAGVAGDIGQALVSQLPNGELDFLQFDTTTGALTGSDLVPSTVGLPRAVGVAEGFFSKLAFSGVGDTDVVVTQLADGSVDLIGFTGTFGPTLSYAASDLLPGSVGTPAIGAVNQDFGVNFNVPGPISGTEGLQLIGKTSSGNPNALYYDTGINDPTNANFLYSSNSLSSSFAGWNIVDGGVVNAGLIFPFT